MKISSCRSTAEDLRPVPLQLSTIADSKDHVFPVHDGFEALQSVIDSVRRNVSLIPLKATSSR